MKNISKSTKFSFTLEQVVIENKNDKFDSFWDNLKIEFKKTVGKQVIIYGYYSESSFFQDVSKNLN